MDLNLSEMGLTSLPAYLPVGMKGLDIFGNYLTEFPKNLPQGLRRLSAAHNHISQLPEILPIELIELNINGNQIIELPPILPPGLKGLNANTNRITGIPEYLPLGLQELDLQDNEVTQLPESITRLRHDCDIYLEGNPLSVDTLSRLQALSTEPDYEGPVFSFSMGGSSTRPPARPLHEAISAWPGMDAPGVREQWTVFEGEDGAADFSVFVDYLRDTVNSDNPVFQQNVAAWLSHLAAYPELRGDTFAISVSASTHCEDRLSFHFNQMKKARVAFDVRQGEYNHRLPELLTLARQMFRLDELEVIAHEKVKSLNAHDPIEVHLAYQVHLRLPLNLPLETENMRFYNYSQVTENDLFKAIDRVTVTEEQDFFKYLSCKWLPWQAAMHLIDPEGYEYAKEMVINATMGDEFSNRVQAQLQQDGLQGIPDAEARVGAQLSSEIAFDIYGRLTNEILRSQGVQELR